mgnify:CR=1 FL=1
MKLALRFHELGEARSDLDDAGGAGDDAMALARDRVILPAVAAFRPDAIVLQCGILFSEP